MFSCAGLWMYAGMLLMLLELAAPGFVVFFFGLAAISVGLGRFAIGDAFTVNWQLAAFSALSVLYLVLLRKWLKSVFAGDKTGSAGLADEYVGRCGKVVEAIGGSAPGRVLIGDAEWEAVSESPIAAGADIRVTARNNLTLSVEPR